MRDRRAWTVVPLDERALTIRSYEDGDDMDVAFVVADVAFELTDDERMALLSLPVSHLDGSAWAFVIASARQKLAATLPPSEDFY